MENTVSKRTLNKLTDVKIKAFIRKARAGKAAVTKLSDGGALYLTLTPAGTPVWRLKYYYGKKDDDKPGRNERLFSIGVYPAVSLEQARAERDAVKAVLREGHDPVQQRHLIRAGGERSAENTFETVAADWLAMRKKEWSPIHFMKSKQAFERDVYPRIGNLPVKDIRPAMIASVVQSIVKRGATDTATKVLQHVNGVFRMAQALGLRDDNPAEPVSEILPSKKRRERIPALLTFPELGGVLRRADESKLSPTVRLAHRLCAFTAARISNVVEAEWSEFHLHADTPTWTIPRAKMKAKDRHHDHRIILPAPIVNDLQKWRKEVGGKGFVFKSPAGGGHITRESLEKAYRVTLDLAGKHSPHGWRSAFSTLAKDNGFDKDAVELTLDHVHDNAVARAYDRGERLEQRIKLMNWWGSELARAQRGADIVSIGKGRAA